MLLLYTGVTRCQTSKFMTLIYPLLECARGWYVAKTKSLSFRGKAQLIVDSVAVDVNIRLRGREKI
jgi:hypothetical protein